MICDNMNDIQKETLDRAKKSWVESGTVYEDIIEKQDTIIYVLFKNNTALAIHPEGKADWVTAGWEGGNSIIVRPCIHMTYVPEAGDYYCDIDKNCCSGLKECTKPKSKPRTTFEQLMTEPRFKYTYQRKEDGHIWEVIHRLSYLDQPDNEVDTMRENDLWELIARSQYVGASDDNDSELYEGDIIEYEYLRERRVVEIGRIETFGVCLKNEEQTKLSHACKLGCVRIGNIYTNPELLEE